MWLLECDTCELKEFVGSNVPLYAILSHRWEEGEVNFKDVFKKRQTEMKGWHKIVQCCQRAKQDGLNYVWADTCCIDKRSSAELSEAINSMYKWYEGAVVCYAYLSDVSAELDVLVVDNMDESQHEIQDNHPCPDCEQFVTDDVDMHRHLLSRALTRSMWFDRGWTLQELLAPEQVIFFDRHWTPLGNKADHAAHIQIRTGIDAASILNFTHRTACFASIMSWAAGRATTRIEDRSYSLLGLLDINIPLLYGEGEKAFQRLQEEWMRTSNDLSILAWTSTLIHSSLPLAKSVDDFKGAVFSSFEPCAREFTWNKDGLVAKCHLQHHCLDVYAMCLGHGTKPGIPSTYPSSVPHSQVIHLRKRGDQFVRVYLDGLPGGMYYSSRDHEEKTEVRVLLCQSQAKLPLFETLKRPYEGVFKRVGFTTAEGSSPASITNYLSSIRGIGPVRRFVPLILESGQQIDPLTPADSTPWFGRLRRVPKPTTMLRQLDHPLFMQPPEASRCRECFMIELSYAEYGDFEQQTLVHFGYSCGDRPTAFVSSILDFPESQTATTSSHVNSSQGSLRRVDQESDKPVWAAKSCNSITQHEISLLPTGAHVILLDVDWKRQKDYRVRTWILALARGLDVVFVREGDGHRILLSFDESLYGYGVYNFPRAWLWPPLPEDTWWLRNDPIDIPAHAGAEK